MQIDSFTKALSDQTRLRLLLLLANNDELCVCEFTQVLGLPQPKISRHLGVLREAGLLTDRKSGLWVYYRLNPELAAWVTTAINSLQQGGEGEAIYQKDQQQLALAVRENPRCS